MEGPRVISSHLFVEGLPDADCHTAQREQDLIDAGVLPTHYFLPGERVALTAAGVVSVREHMARVTHEACGPFTCEPAQNYPLFRPPLVAKYKGITDPEFPFKARVVFDLDPVDKSRDCTEEIDRDWVRGFRSLLNEHLDGDFSHAKYAVFSGSFADKATSCHLYFYEFSWANDARNAQVPDITLQALNDYCADVNLEVDKSVLNSGLKLPFMDKFVRDRSRGNYWRGDRLTLAWHSKPSSINWPFLFGTCDPICISDDSAYLNSVTWVHGDVPAEAEMEVEDRVIRANATERNAIGSTVRERIASMVRQWVVDTEYRQYRHADHMIWVPQVTYCPIKQDHHSSRGKSYVRVDLNTGGLLIKCHSAHCATFRGITSTLDWNRINEVPAEVREAVAWCNERFAQVLISQPRGATHLKIMRYPANYFESVKFMDAKTFHDAYQEQNFRMKVGRRFVTKYATREWLKSHNKMRYDDGLVFDPLDSGATPGKYNTWRGYNPAVIEKADQLEEDYTEAEIAEMWALFATHMHDHLCGGDDALYDYLLNWIWLLLFKPHIKPEVALVLSGPRGAGKTTFFEFLQQICGHHHVVTIHDSKRLHGRFNAQLAEAKLLFLDEACADKHIANEAWLKGILTSHTVQVEQKYMPTEEVASYHTLIIASNDAWAIPAGEGARRFQCLDVTKPANANDYFAQLHAELEGDGPAAFYSSLRGREVGDDWHPRQTIYTEALWRQQYHTMHEVMRWWYHVLKDGQVTPDGMDIPANFMGHLPNDEGEFLPDNCWGINFPQPLVHAAFKLAHPESSVSKQAMWVKLREMCNTEVDLQGFELFVSSRVQIGRRRFRLVALPSLRVARRVFCEHHGVPMRVWRDWN